MNLDFPLHFDNQGRTASSLSDDSHVLQMIELVLFTTPGERVNRPTFGSGLLQAVFAPNSDELAAATEFLAKGALQQWLGDVITVNAVSVTLEGSTLNVTVRYVVRRTQQAQTAQLSRRLP
jgi:phage baseplate assembly protein W